MRRGLLIALSIVVAACVVSGAAGADSPGALVTSAVAAMRAQHSYHYVATQLGTSSSPAQVTIVGDATRTTGIQRIHYAEGSRAGNVTVLVVSNTAYIRGDAFTLTNYMGFPTPSAAQFAGKWLELPHSVAGFAEVAADVRLDNSALEELKMPAPVHLVGNSVVRGQHVIGVRGTLHHSNQTALETLYVRSSDHLPVEQRFTQGGKSIGGAVYSNWGEPVHVSAPTQAITLG
jgi:hypothetical protein